MKLISKPIQTSNSDSGRITRRRFRVNSFGLRLFLVIMGGAVLGMGGMAFLFGETVKYQAEDQIKDTLRSKVSTINDVIDQAETLAYGLNISVATLHVRRAETPETYQELTRQLFQGRPDFVTGLGFGQKEYGILPSREWFFPYYQASSSTTSASADVQSSETQPTEALSDTRYVDQVDPEYFYPETDRYRDYFLPQVNAWTTPYQNDRGVLLTYYSQIFDTQGEWLGTAVIDVDGTYLSKVLDEPVLRDGGELILLTEAGDVIANPSDPSQIGTQTYENIPGLSDVWSQINRRIPGFIEGETGYWAYTQIPERDWLVMAYVPYDVVFGQVTLITIGATTVVGLLLAGVVALAIRYLNRRLRSVLDECHRLSEIDDEMMQELQSKDELEQLSLSFFYLLEQLTQQRPILNQVTQRMQSLEQVVTTTADEGQQQSQLVTQVQQWVDTTDDLSHVLTEQAIAVEEAGSTTREALEVGHQKITSAIAELKGFRQNTQKVPTQIQDLLVATDVATQVTQEHQIIVNMAKALILNGFTLSTRASQQRNPHEFANTTVQFQRLINQFQQLVDQLGQASAEQQNKRKQVQAVGADLSSSIKAFDRHIQRLTSSIETSQDAVGRGQVTAHQITQVGEQVTQSSQQLGELVQTIQQTVHNIVVLADATQTRLQNRT